jgi:hypothetical protein
MQPSARARREFAAGLRTGNAVRGAALAWVLAVALVAWAVASGHAFGQPLPVRACLGAAMLYGVMGALFLMLLVLPGDQVRLEPRRIVAGTGKHWKVHELGDFASYRLADFAHWRALALARRDGATLSFDVPVRVAPDEIHRYFAERGIPDADA